MCAQFRDDRLRELLDERNLTLDQFAAMIGRSYPQAIRLKMGHSQPSIATFARIVRGLGCTADELLDVGDDDRPTDLGPEIDAWVAKVVAAMPPMTDEQARRVSVALFGNAAPSSGRSNRRTRGAA